MKRYEVLRQELESGSAFNATDKERAIAAAAAETFEAREEEEGQAANGAPRSQGMQWLLPVFGSRKNELPGGPESFARSARVLRDDPQKLRLLQVCIPQQGLWWPLPSLELYENWQGWKDHLLSAAVAVSDSILCMLLLLVLLPILQEKLPGISSLLADLKARESQRAQGDESQN